ncbi:hypothetical protein G4Y79_05670 [Phototrophicus methaneseepsis]|uniref:Uncharacterized protein n=1 Tax=Phototrophicus methaneseepsis TaxID=2710758 RepID=A0A7S8EBH3_9CHLR|nr:hypothetical protein [Phototrophicus methaneseepsis]QPC83867.1 hypothetical protein G4Y79_05670 [Phototrophicus methaneseepsis]
MIALQEYVDFAVEYSQTKFWLDIQQARRLLRYDGAANQALPIYKACLNENLTRLYDEQSASRISPHQDAYALNWYVIYLAEYFHVQEGEWHVWMKLSAPLFQPDIFDKLSLESQSFLVSTRGWAQIKQRGQQTNLRTVIAEQEAYLDRLPARSVEAALHHILLGYVTQQMRQKGRSLYHHHMSLDILTLKDEPFYYLRAREAYASTLYFLRASPAEAYEAIREYEAIKSIAQGLNNGDDIREQDYNIGWAKAELDAIPKQEALRSFQEGYLRASKFPERIYQKAMYAYGQSFVYVHLGELEAAYTLLKEAVLIFASLGSELKLAMCLQLQATVCQLLGQIDTASEHARNGLYHMKFSDNKTQLYHLHRRLVILYAKEHAFHLMIYHLLQLYRLNILIGKPFTFF